MTLSLYRVTLPYAVCGLEVDAAGVVVRAAPLLHWAVGKRVAVVAGWVRRRGGACVKVEALEMSHAEG